MRQKPMTPESLDWWSDKLAVLTAVLTLAAAAAGVFAYLFATWNADAKDKQLKKFQAESKVELQKSLQATAEANALAAQAQLAAEQLKEQLAWRTIDEPTAKKLLAALIPKKNGFVSIDCVANDPESQYLAVQYARIFQLAGWNVSERSVPFTQLAFGMFVPDNPNSDCVEDIRKSLSSSGIPFSTLAPGDPPLYFGNGLPTGLARLIVGSKLPPR